MMRLPLLLLPLALLAGCDGREKHQDVSAEPRSKAVLGARYEVIGELDAYGIRPHSRAQVNYVTLIPPPGIGGSEVGFRIPVRPGSTITVRKVVKTNRLFDPDMNLEVALDGTPFPVLAPVRIAIFRGNEGKGYLQLNPAIYRKLPSG